MSKLHIDTEATAAYVERLLGALSANESVEKLAWSSCNGLAALSIANQRDALSHLHDPSPCRLYILLPGQPLDSMRVNSAEHGFITWSPAGDSLLVGDSFTRNMQLVSTTCTSVLRFAGSYGGVFSLWPAASSLREW